MIFHASKPGEPWFATQITTIYADNRSIMGCGVGPWGSMKMDPVQLYHAESTFGAVQAAQIITRYLMGDSNELVKEPVWIHEDGEIQDLVKSVITFVTAVAQKTPSDT